MKILIALLLLLAALITQAQSWEAFAAARLAEYLGRPVAAGDVESYALLFEDGACAAFLEDDSVWSLNNAVIDVWYYGNTYRLYTHDYNAGGALCAGETLDAPNSLPPIEPGPPDECEDVRAARAVDATRMVRADLIACLS